MSAEMAPRDRHAWLIRTLSSRLATEAAPCDICECVCVCILPICYWREGAGGTKGFLEGPRGLPLQVRNDRGDSWISALSLPLSIPHPSKPAPPYLTPPSLPIDRSCATGPWIPMIRSASEPITCTALMYAMNVNHPCPRRGADHWNKKKKKKYTHTKEVLNAKHLSAQQRSPSVSLGVGRWDSCTMRLIYYQLSMNVNRPAHMCIHHSWTLMCQKIRGRRARGHVCVSDVCAERLSFTRTINYTNNIQSLHVY